jgi:hypothetical protein
MCESLGGTYKVPIGIDFTKSNEWTGANKGTYYEWLGAAYDHI